MQNLLLFHFELARYVQNYIDLSNLLKPYPAASYLDEMMDNNLVNTST